MTADVRGDVSCTYSLMLPVEVTVHPDGTVVAKVDLTDASDIYGVPCDEEMDDEGLDTDSRIIENAVIQARVVVSA